MKKTDKLECEDCGWTGFLSQLVTIQTKEPYAGCPTCYSRKINYFKPNSEEEETVCL